MGPARGEEDTMLVSRIEVVRAAGFHSDPQTDPSVLQHGVCHRPLTNTERREWETLPGWRWDMAPRERFLPTSEISPDGTGLSAPTELRVFCRLPMAGRPVPCRLCESDFNSLSELRQHLRDSHFVGDPSGPLTPDRAEEEHRKRIFYLEEIFGPF